MRHTIIAAVAAATLSLPTIAQDKKDAGKITDVHPEGRSFTYEGKKYTVSGSRTDVMIAGKQADRSQLKSGMTCKVEAGKGDEAKKVDCK